MKARKTDETVPLISEYPYLASIERSGACVWLVTAPSTGVVILPSTTADQYKLGYTSCNLREDGLVPFTGVIKLHN